MIIVEIVIGDVATYDGLLGVPVMDFKLWPETEWIESPGGLGVRHMPKKKGGIMLFYVFENVNHL